MNVILEPPSSFIIHPRVRPGLPHAGTWGGSYGKELAEKDTNLIRYVVLYARFAALVVVLVVIR